MNEQCYLPFIIILLYLYYLLFNYYYRFKIEYVKKIKTRKQVFRLSNRQTYRHCIAYTCVLLTYLYHNKHTVIKITVRSLTKYIRRKLVIHDTCIL